MKRMRVRVGFFGHAGSEDRVVYCDMFKLDAQGHFVTVNFDEKKDGATTTWHRKNFSIDYISAVKI